MGRHHRGPAACTAWLALGSMLWLACASPATELVVVVASDLAPGTEIARVEITTRDESGATIATRDIAVAASAGEGEVTLPFSFGASPSGDAGRPLRIEARAFRAGEDVPFVTRRAIAPFVAGERRRLVLFLGRACEDVECADVATTCADGACVDARVPVSALDPVISGMELSFDSGVSPPPLDGGAVPDAGTPCGRDPDCDEPVRVEVGDGFACALRYSGRVACWGDSAALGQLGDGAATPSRVPVTVGGVGAVHDLIVGDAFACASNEARIWCWGANERGQLAQGAGSPPSLPDPAAIEGVAGASRMLGTAETACGPSTKTGVQCWGRALAGVPGAFGEMCGDVECALSPSSQDALAGLAWLSDEGHTCIVRDAALACSGVNAFGEVGDGTRASRDMVVPVPALPWVWAAATTPRSSCAVSAVFADEITTSSVHCWGADDLGQLGAPGAATARCSATAGSTEVACALEPVPVTGVSQPLEISATGHTICAREDGGRVLCWGSDADGALGDGVGSPAACDGIDAAGTGCARAPVAVLGLSDAIDVDARGGTFCAVRRAGTVVCWGRGWGTEPIEVAAFPR